MNATPHADTVEVVFVLLSTKGALLTATVNRVYMLINLFYSVVLRTPGLEADAGGAGGVCRRGAGGAGGVPRAAERGRAAARGGQAVQGGARQGESVSKCRAYVTRE
eukprot:7939914-Pyramimonas_sp.AAC.2